MREEHKVAEALSELDMAVQLEAANALLDDGVSVPFKELKIPFCKPRELRVTMRRPRLGNQIRIAKHYLKIGVNHKRMLAFTPDEEMEFVAKHGKRISKMIALTICRGLFSSRFLTPIVAFLVRGLVDDVFIQGANLRFIMLLGTKSFTNIIRSAEVANPLKPRLSQRTTMRS